MFFSRVYVSENMSEWLRRQPAKLMGYARVGSNPTVEARSKIEQGTKPKQATTTKIGSTGT
jgi:hypothetical protein